MMVINKKIITSITVEQNLCKYLPQNLLPGTFYLDSVEVVARERQKDKSKDNQYFSIFKNKYPKPVPLHH